MVTPSSSNSLLKKLNVDTTLPVSLVTAYMAKRKVSQSCPDSSAFDDHYEACKADDMPALYSMTYVLSKLLEDRQLVQMMVTEAKNEKAGSHDDDGMPCTTNHGTVANGLPLKPDATSPRPNAGASPMAIPRAAFPPSHSARPLMTAAFSDNLNPSGASDW